MITRVGLRPAGIALFTFLATISIGCGRKAGTPSTDTTTTAPAAVREGLGAPIGRSDPALHAIAPVLGPWVEMWRRAIPGFELDSLYRGGARGALRTGVVQPASDYPMAPQMAPAFEVLGADSPGGRYRLVFDHYLVIEGETNGQIEISGEPDSAPVLIDRRTGTANRFEFCGTSCGYHWGGWIDSMRFALGSWTEVDAAGDTLRGVVGVYSLADSTETRYLTRAVAPPDFRKYSAAWNEWAAARYRAWKKSRPSS